MPERNLDQPKEVYFDTARPASCTNPLWDRPQCDIENIYNPAHHEYHYHIYKLEIRVFGSLVTDVPFKQRPNMYGINPLKKVKRFLQ